MKHNITLHELDALTFFSLKELPQPSVDPELLANAESEAMEEDNHVLLMDYLDNAMIPDENESGVDNFIFHLFRTIGYTAPRRLPRLQSNYPLFIRRTEQTVTIDACIRDIPQNNIRLIVMIERRLDKSDDVQARLVAGAIAVFHHNNSIRERNGCPLLKNMVIPGIVMVGTAPVFFKILVTSIFTHQIEQGIDHTQKSHVEYCHPPVLRPDLLFEEGMKPLDNRRVIFQCFEAFKAIAGIT
ncbi:hypothetical protein BDQ17DRAFT_1433954 [Cyathus striatus]|nr:hypothetical protein BDQ17DRAFT_1433954 [Cyathus striatus]